MNNIDLMNFWIESSDEDYNVMEVLYTETGDPKYRPCTLLKKMVRAGKLGQKTKQGFYSYN